MEIADRAATQEILAARPRPGNLNGRNRQYLSSEPAFIVGL